MCQILILLERISRPGKFVATVLACDRTENDPVAKDAGVYCKANASICGKPMILRVLDA